MGYLFAWQTLALVTAEFYEIRDGIPETVSLTLSLTHLLNGAPVPDHKASMEPKNLQCEIHQDKGMFRGGTTVVGSKNPNVLVHYKYSEVT